MAARIVSYFLTVPPGERGQSEEMRRWQKSIVCLSDCSLCPDIRAHAHSKREAGGPVRPWSRQVHGRRRQAQGEADLLFLQFIPAGGQGALTGRSCSPKQLLQSLAGGTQRRHWRRQSARGHKIVHLKRANFMACRLLHPV